MNRFKHELHLLCEIVFGGEVALVLFQGRNSGLGGGQGLAQFPGGDVVVAAEVPNRIVFDRVARSRLPDYT